MDKANYGVLNLSGDNFIVLEKDESTKTKWALICKLFNLDSECTDRITIKGKVEYFGAPEDPNYIKTFPIDEFVHCFGDAAYNDIRRIGGRVEEPKYVTVARVDYIMKCLEALNKSGCDGYQTIRDCVVKNVVDISY